MLARPQAPAPALPHADQAPRPAPAPSQPKDTPELKEARIFLDDAQKFLAQQQEVPPTITSIANEAARLQVAITNSDSTPAVQAEARLKGLLASISGFDYFLKQQEAERNRQRARELAEAMDGASKNIFFIDAYRKAHLGDPKTASLLAIRKKIDDARLQKNVEGINGGSDALRAYVADNGLQDQYQQLLRDYANPAPPPTVPKPNQSLVDRLGLTDKSRFLVEGPQQDIILLYNATPSAPHVWKNIRGDLVFQDAKAQLCVAHEIIDLAMVRSAERLLSTVATVEVIRSERTCNASDSMRSTDVIVIQRGGLLKQKEAYILGVAKFVEQGQFRVYQTITDYEATRQRQDAFSLQLEAEVKNGSRDGDGVISVSKSSTVCIIPPKVAHSVDGLEALLTRDESLIAPDLSGSWNFIQADADLAFRGLQRKQCGYVAGDAASLKVLIDALDRDQIRYSLAAAWYSEEDLARATFDVKDKREQAILIQQERDRKKKEQDELKQLREKQKQQKDQIERALRDKNGPRARALTMEIGGFVRSLAEQRTRDTDTFPGYSTWLEARFADGWVTFDVSSEVADFGAAQWHDRLGLDAILVKSVILLKNRVLGKYETVCFEFGLVDDVEFSIRRERIAKKCSDQEEIDAWKIGLRFKSQWNAE